jgi:hypothetical protein
MKDQRTAVMEAVGQARAMLANYLEFGPRNPDQTLGS